MSVDIHAFLGSNVLGLESRLIASFGQIGFRIALHPDMDLLQANSTGCMCVAILETPPTVKRLAPGVPVIASFGYDAKVLSQPVAMGNWPPRGVKKHCYEVCTRTAAGRSRCSYFAQALVAAFLAKETGGYFWVNGDALAISGKKAVERILSQLNSLDASVLQLQQLMGSLEREGGIAEANRFGKAMHDSLNPAFDVGATPFTEWPTIENYCRFAWAEPISQPPFVPKRESWLSRISLYWSMITVIVVAMVLVTVIYS